MIFDRLKSQCKQVDAANAYFYGEFMMLPDEDKSIVRDLTHMLYKREKRRRIAALWQSVLLVAIITTMIQILYWILGQSVYENNVIKDTSAFLLIPGVVVLIRFALDHIAPSVKTRKMVLTRLLILSVPTVVLLPVMLYVTIGSISCWDTAIAVVVSALITLTWCDAVFSIKHLQPSTTHA